MERSSQISAKFDQTETKGEKEVRYRHERRGFGKVLLKELKKYFSDLVGFDACLL